MKLAVISDLHGAPLPPIEEEVNFILAAGDLKTEPFQFGELQKLTGKITLSVAGNHEFYGSSYVKARQNLNSEGYWDNVEHQLGGVRFLCCTLWTDFDLMGRDRREMAMEEGRRGLNDFRQIKGWSPELSRYVHKKSVDWLTHALIDYPSDRRTVVMTHHAPSRRSIHPKYEGDLLNCCFASNLEYLFPYVDLWVHGHVHSPFDYTVGRCRVVCNPMGYRGENPGPYKAKIIDL